MILKLNGSAVDHVRDIIGNLMYCYEYIQNNESKVKLKFYSKCLNSKTRQTK